MKLNRIIVISILIMSPFIANAQYYEPTKQQKQEAKNINNIPFWDRVHFGGNFGAQFGSQTAVYLSPSAFYDVTRKFKVGVGLNYIYTSQEVLGSNLTYSVYGAKMFLYFEPFQNFIVNTDFERNFIDRNYSSESDPYWMNAWFVGAGYAFPMGKRSRLIVSVSYDLLYDTTKSYYSSPWRPTIGFFF